jgi:SOUL heme-binding protein
LPVTLTRLALGLVGIVVVGLGIWTLYSLTYARGTEQAPFKLLRQAAGYEVRLYPELLVAETAMTGMGREATTAAFWVLAGYIFGANEGAEKIAMTAPVTMAPKPENIAMTAPVIVSGASGGPRTMAFVMPSKYTMESLPKPKDSRVTFRRTLPRTVAVLRYTWYQTPDRFAAKADELAKLLQRDGVKPAGAPIYAGYDAPFVVPFLMRNEVQIEIAP